MCALKTWIEIQTRKNRVFLIGLAKNLGRLNALMAINKMTNLTWLEKLPD